MYTHQIRTYDIDLGLPEKQRWAEVIEREADVARALTANAIGQLSPAARRLARAVGPLFRVAYRLSGGRYRGEMAAWARALGVSASSATMLNCSYEGSHVGSRMGLGCTAGVRWVRGLGMVHLRNMDWDLPGLGAATRLFRFHAGEHAFVTVGITGLVGVLSGMVPGAYSATINWAPAARMPRFRFGPLFLLREVLETCPTYEEAVAALEHTPLSSPVFFVVCGRRKGEACVIERLPERAVVRAMRGETLVQANHHLAAELAPRNALMADGGAETDGEYEDECRGEWYEDGQVWVVPSALEYSRDRAAALQRRLRRAGRAGSLRRAARGLMAEPVRNEATEQQMAFCPTSGELLAWRRTV